MKSALRQLIFLVPVALLSLVAVVHAATPCTSCLNSPTLDATFQGFISTAMKALVKISLPIITIFIVYSGFLFVTAQGNQGKLETAKRNFFFSVLGALLILAAWILATIIAGTVTQILGT